MADIGDFVYRSFVNSFVKGELSVSQKLGLISMLPKGSKPRNKLKKLETYFSTKRHLQADFCGYGQSTKTVLDTIIHENQRGFLAGRFIGENTRLLYDVINYCNEENLPALLLLLDYEKAFDTVSWNFIFSVLYFITSVTTLYGGLKYFSIILNCVLCKMGIARIFYP